MVYCIGLTGTIASGKSLVAETFSRLGINTFNADDVAKQLTRKGQPAYEAISQHFGAQVLLEDGELNRKALRSIIFSNAIEKKWLEALLHPLIREELTKQVSQATSPYCIVEIPLLNDKISYPYLNEILLVYSPEEKQLERIIVRDHCSKEEALSILSTQPPFEERAPKADRLLFNDGTKDDLIAKVMQLHQIYQTL